MTEKMWVGYRGAELRRNTPGAAGFDLRASVGGSIAPGRAAVVGTGLYLEIPAGYEAQIRSRSGLAANQNVFVLNSPGTIDSDYRGEIKVILFNAGGNAFDFSPGDRIAQLVFAAVPQVDFYPVKEMSETQRGVGGFGSTGVK